VWQRENQIYAAEAQENLVVPLDAWYNLAANCQSQAEITHSHREPGTAYHERTNEGLSERYN